MTLDQRIAAERAEIEQARRKLRRICKLQSKLNISAVTLKTTIELASRRLWEMEQGYKLLRKGSQFDNDAAERATAALIAFNPLHKSTTK